MIAYMLFGFLLYFRTEMRKGVYPTLIFRLSAYRRDDPILNSDYPIRVPAKLHGAEIDKVIKAIFPKYLSKIHAKMAQCGRCLTAEYDLPLILLWKINAKAIFSLMQVSEQRQKDYEKAMAKIIDHWGERPIHEITPGLCFPVLSSLSQHVSGDCIRIMNYLTAYEINSGNMIINSWSSYQLESARHLKGSAYTNAHYIKETVLAPSDLELLIEYCLTKAYQTCDMRYFSMLLLVVSDIPEALICALNFDDIKPLEHFPGRLCATIHQQYTDNSSGRCRLQPLNHDYSRRILPLPSILGDLFRSFTKREKHIVAHPKNANRRCPPKQLSEWIAGEWDKIFEGRIPWKGHSALIHATVEHGLRKAAFSDDEISYYFGLKPRTVTANNYNYDLASPMQAKS